MDSKERNNHKHNTGTEYSLFTTMVLILDGYSDICAPKGVISVIDLFKAFVYMEQQSSKYLEFFFCKIVFSFMRAQQVLS